MKLTRFTVQSCCGGTTIIYKVDQPLSKELISKLIFHKFIEQTNFTQAGILYMNNEKYILTGPIGSNRLQVKCKIQNCTQNLNDLEALLSTL